MKKIAFAFFLLVVSCSAKQHMISAHDAIPNLEETLHTLQGQTKALVVFPARIPQEALTAKQYYVTTSTTTDGYRIYLSAEEKCQGVHYCTDATISAEIAGNPTVYYDIDNKEITTQVLLINNIKAYYTKGHAMADYWPPMLTWRSGKILYTIAWELHEKNAREILISLSNEAIKNEYTKN